MATRCSGLTVSVFTLGGTAYIGDLEEATLTVDNNLEEGRGIKDVAKFPIPLRGNWRIEATLFCASDAPLMSAAVGTAPSVSVTFTVNASTSTAVNGKYTGTANIKTAAHRTPAGLQKVNCTLSGKGALTVTHN